MKGTNTFVFNHATMMDIVERYLNQLVGEELRVLSVEALGETSPRFEVTVESVEKSND